MRANDGYINQVFNITTPQKFIYEHVNMYIQVDLTIKDCHELANHTTHHHHDIYETIHTVVVVIIIMY